VYPVAHLQKMAVVAEIFPLDGAEFIDRVLFKSSLNLGCKIVQTALGRRLCHFVDKDLTEIRRSFREQKVFSIFVQYWRPNIAKLTYNAHRCLLTARSTSSERTLLLVCCLVAKV